MDIQLPAEGQPMHCLPLFFSFHMNRIASPRIINRIIITIILPILLSLLSCSLCSFCRLFGLSSLCGHCHSAKYILHQFHLLLTDIHTMSGQNSDAPHIQQCFLFYSTPNSIGYSSTSNAQPLAQGLPMSHLPW